MRWPLENTYKQALPGLASPWAPVPVAEPRLLALNESLAEELGLDPAELAAPEGVAVLAGNAVPDGAEPVAQAYAGHQFGYFSGLLGDGRALLLGEVIDRHGRRRDVALKGSGRTPYSRGGDGRAVLGPVLREYLLGEAMHALGIPTTRALAAVATGEAVRREQPEPGAVLTRVAASHLRVGTFELARTAGDVELLQGLFDYARARHYPDLGDDPLEFLAAVADRQASLIAQWLGAGFIHGVMNTDNMTISGETIDYGPCAFLEAYDEYAVFSSIDHQGRYRYGAQPAIAAWNLARLAESLLPLVPGEPQAAIEDATAQLAAFAHAVEGARLRVFAGKLGLAEVQPGDDALIGDLLGLLAKEHADFTLTFRRLAAVLRGDADAMRARVLDLAAYDAWQARWLDRLAGMDAAAVSKEMDRVNPLYLPRNHLVEEALTEATAGDLGPFEELLAAVRAPYDERPGLERLAEPAPAGFTDSYRTYCGT